MLHATKFCLRQGHQRELDTGLTLDGQSQALRLMARVRPPEPGRVRGALPCP